MEGKVKLGHHLFVALSLAASAATASFAQAHKQPTKAAGDAQPGATGQPAKTRGQQDGPGHATNKGTSFGSRSGGSKGINAKGTQTSGGQHHGKASVGGKEGGSSANPVDLRGGLPRPKGKNEELHKKVQEIVKQVHQLGKKTNAIKPSQQSHDRPQTSTPGAGVDTPRIATGSPSRVKPTAAGPTAINHSIITGTGMSRPGSGTSTIGGAAKSAAGVIAGTGFRSKHP